MPTYDVLHKPTGVVSEKFLTIAKMEEFLKENPDYEITFLKMNVGDPVAMGITQPPSDFLKHVIAPIEKRYFGKSRESRYHAKREI